MTVEVDILLLSEELQRLVEAAEERGRGCASRSSTRCWSRSQLDPLETDCVYRELEKRGDRGDRRRRRATASAAGAARSPLPAAVRVDDRRAAALPARGRPASAADAPPRRSRSRSGSSAATLRAKQRMIQSNLRLVVSIAKNYRNQGLPVPRPDPGGHARADPRRREVRLAPRLQVLDLRDLVDPPGGRARARRQGADDPHAGAHRRAAAQAEPGRAPALDRARPRADARGDRREANLPLDQATEVRAAPGPTSLDAPVGEDDDAVVGDFVSGDEPLPEELVEERLRSQIARGRAQVAPGAPPQT